MAFVYVKDNNYCWLKDSTQGTRPNHNTMFGMLEGAPAASPAPAAGGSQGDVRRDLATRLMAVVHNRQTECRNQRHVGGKRVGAVEDGAWDVCFDGLRPPCVVYSFGIADDWTFDEAMAEFGCEVHAFDPSLGLSDHDHKRNVHFHNMGISDVDSDSVTGHGMRNNRAQQWKVRRLDTVMKELGHDTVDLVKIDVEGSEWGVLSSLLVSEAVRKIKQMTFEVHFWDMTSGNEAVKGVSHSESTIRGWLTTLETLESNGFNLFHTHLNPQSTWEELGLRQRTACCFELSFLNREYHAP